MTLHASERNKFMENLLQRAYVVTKSRCEDVYLHRVPKDLINPALEGLKWTQKDKIDGGQPGRRFKATFGIESTRTKRKPDNATPDESGPFYVCQS